MNAQVGSNLTALKKKLWPVYNIITDTVPAIQSIQTYGLSNDNSQGGTNSRGIADRIAFLKSQSSKRIVFNSM